MKTIKLIIPVAIWMLLLASGCKTSRASETETYDETAVISGDIVSADTLLTNGMISEQSADTLTCKEEGSGVIEIIRDSVGQPVRIEWKRRGNATKTRNSDNLTTMAGLSVDSSKSSFSSQSVATGHFKKKRVEVEADSSPGWITIWPIILLILIAVMAWSWKGGER